jgi:hypothetical protein
MLLGSLGRADSRGGVGMSAHNHHHRLHHLEDDVYEDFSSPFPGAMIGSGGFSGTPAATAMKGPGTALGRGGLAPQMGFNGAAPGTALRTGEARPMTSVAGAGYHSKRTPGQFDPLKQKIRAEALAEKADNSPEDMAKEMELQTHRLIEHSAAAMVKGDATIALERAKVMQSAPQLPGHVLWRQPHMNGPPLWFSGSRQEGKGSVPSSGKAQPNRANKPGPNVRRVLQSSTLLPREWHVQGSTSGV